MISDKIVIHHPTLDEICDYGEQDYFKMISTITATAPDMKVKLFDMGVDYTEVDNFELFYNMISRIYSKEQTSIIFGDLDFQKFNVYTKEENNEVTMYDKENDIEIDGYTYELITDTLRKIHLLKKNEQVPANESTKMILIEDDREEHERNKNKKYHSQLKNLISAMVNSEGFKYNHNEVWQMNIYAFMDSVQRISKIKNANLLLQSGYSGYGIDLKEIDKKQLDWLGELK